ncbi:MAG: hypothetical protein AMXMBFR84_44290 [Candidatus Hydrogenedentota bacterium]
MACLARPALILVTCLAIASMQAASAQERTINLDPPGDREFLLDLADMVDEADEQSIRDRCSQVLGDTAIPIVVVTIESMAQYGPPGIRIETFATLLFNQWGIGHPEWKGQSWNRGVLLLVSEQDRKARIELGADWAHEYDAVCQEIMDKQIVSRFRQGQFSKGILAGVESLDNMSRGIPLPAAPVFWWHYAIVIGGIVLLVFTVVSLIRSGMSGWAWLVWGAVFALIGYVLYQALANSGRSSGSFSGGSFGGGFSGGGGATGSW